MEDEIDGDEDISKLSVDQFKDMIKDIIAQEVGGGDAEAEMGMDMDGGDIEGMGDEAPIEEPDMDAPEEGDDEIDLDELIRELDSLSNLIDDFPRLHIIFSDAEDYNIPKFFEFVGNEEVAFLPPVTGG